MRIGMGQMNATVGDLEGNAQKVISFAQRAVDASCELFITPELVTTGYPPQDLILKSHFVTEQKQVLTQRFAVNLPLPSLVGFVDCDSSGNLYNAAAYIVGGQVEHVVYKTLLPTYDVFDERRYFKPAKENLPIDIRGERVGVTICEDIWDEDYGRKVVSELAEQGVNSIVNISSSPYRPGKREERLYHCLRHAKQHGLPIVYCNLVGAQDELIFDGESIAVNASGGLIGLGPKFKEDLVVIETTTTVAVEQPQVDESQEVFSALCLGVKDYFQKCGFKRAVIGLSGGVDSTLVACIAAEALDPKQVIGVAMPSRFTAEMSDNDAALLASNLGIEFYTISIEESVKLAAGRFTDVFGPYQQPVTQENLQARERGKILMEISNDKNALVLSTGNKTEYALGYTTLYGDMCGGLAVIGDVSKPQVYDLCRHYNNMQGREVIPRRILERPPSAELREKQVDPFDYDRIGPLTELVIEEHLSRAELLAEGYAADEVDMVLRLVRTSEYKRKQAAPVLRVSQKAFGIGRKMPIVNHFKQ